MVGILLDNWRRLHLVTGLNIGGHLSSMDVVLGCSY